MSKVILVLCDGLRDDTAAEMMGYMEHLVETQCAVRYKISGEMPTTSRPVYECIHTGTPVNVHGITSNWVVRPSKLPNIFSVAQQNGRVTAAAAYSWFSELYNGCPYKPGFDKEIDDPALAIQHGRFYTADSMPDEETFNTGQNLLNKFHPDYLLIHPMGMDYLGHTYGPESSQYRNNAILIDTILATYVPGWLEAGYVVLVTSDHGMGGTHTHGGTLPEVRDVPLYIIQPEMQGVKKSDLRPSHLNIAPAVLRLMNLPVPATMKQVSLFD